MRKSLIPLGVLVLLGASLAAAKNYEFLLPTAAQAGNVTLAAGHYRLRLEGNTAIFTNIRSSETYSVPVRVANGPGHESGDLEMKIALKKHAGIERIDSIELEDANALLEF